jgi:hypothetical protein
LLIEIEKKKKKEKEIHLQQDGAPLHYFGRVCEYLKTLFLGRWVDRAAPIAWSPHSLDLAPWIFLLWGFVSPLPANVVGLRTRIIAPVEEVAQEMLGSA